MSDIPELNTGRKLLHTVDSWLRSARDSKRAAAKANPALMINAADEQRAAPSHFYGRHMAFYR